MITFSIAVVLLSALAAVLILQRAASAARRSDPDPTLAVYRRQLSEIDDLAERGLLAEGELRTAKAEAARRLLQAAQARGETAAAPTPGASKGMRLAVLAGAIAAPLLALGLYMALGSPGSPDQPFSERLKAWAQSDPSQLTPSQMAALLQTVVKRRPGDAEPLTYLARAQAASGNPAAAAETIRKAIRLEPKDADLYANLGILLLMQGQGEETPAATQAFGKALALDPSDAPALYHIGRGKIAAGNLNGGLADWRTLLAELPDQAPERLALQQEIADTVKAGHLVAEQPAPAAPRQQPQAQPGGGAAALAGVLTGQAPPQDQAPQGGPAGDQKAFIESMVQRLAAQLQQQPDDPAGWARLIRSYAVLGEPDKLKAALDQAHRIFKGRPDALNQVDNAMNAPQGAE